MLIATKLCTWLDILRILALLIKTDQLAKRRNDMTIKGGTDFADVAQIAANFGGPSNHIALRVKEAIARKCLRLR